MWWVWSKSTQGGYLSYSCVFLTLFQFKYLYSEHECSEDFSDLLALTFSNINSFTWAISLIFTLPKHSVCELLQKKIETIGFSRFDVYWTQTDELDNQPKYMFTTHIWTFFNLTK